jgi:hypothetical protein
MKKAEEVAEEEIAEEEAEEKREEVGARLIRRRKE